MIQDTFLMAAVGVCVVVASLIPTHLRATTPGDTIFINSIEELAEFAAKDDVLIKMKAGTYALDNTKTSRNITLKKYREGKPPSDYPVSALLHFSGNNSSYNLEGVEINISSALHRAFGKNHIYEVFVTGNNNHIHGLTVRDVGDEYPHFGAIMLHVMGDDNVISAADLYIHGSSPYGYGHLLGKGGNPLVKLHKHSSLLVTGQNTKLLACKVFTHGFGHGIVMQGAVNTLIQDCYVEGEMRPTNEMLAETSGLAFGVGFKSDYPPGKIMPDEIKALSEDGIRSYPSGHLNGRRTKGITVINCTVKNMRSGFDLSANLPPTHVIGSTAIACQEKGYSIGSDGIIKNCKGDALYGPLITFIGKHINNCTVELALVDTVSEYPVHRLAEINGSGHHITIRNYQGKKRSLDAPIVFGESFWDDVHRFRNPDAPHGAFAGAENIKLLNDTGMPVRLNDLAINCSISNAVSTQQTKVINAGVGGNATSDLLKRVDGDVLAHKPDLVLLMVGTNDMLNSRKMIGYEEYASNLEVLIKHIKTAGSELVVMSPIPADSAYLFTRHDKRLFKESPNQKLDSIAKIAAKLAIDNQVYFFDLNAEFTQLNLPLHNRDMLIRNVKNSGKSDGVHPTALGYRFIAKNVYHFLKEHKLIGEGKKIICFGDSITRGGGNDANYPAYLRELISELHK